ncbi:MAG: hypothetical protein JJT82_04895 [Legionellaceae bacterium]|nr:hypothetical protein [Legionellaceae bacterium]
MKRTLATNPYGSFAVKKKKKEVTNAAILAYIKENGFGTPTPPLVSGLNAEVFRQHYYDKQELMVFCREKGISTTGLKEDLNKRIETYLRTGHVIVAKPVSHSSKPDSQGGLRLDKRVVNYKSDPTTRAFFEKHIPDFKGFSALVQKQIKLRLAEGDEFTYGDAIEMHKQFMRDKQSGRLTTVAHDSCQYNQFFMDYKADVDPKLHSNKEAWMLVRQSAGPKTYQRYKDRIEEIRNILSVEDVQQEKETASI